MQIDIPIIITVKEPEETAKAAIKDFSCPDNKQLFLSYFSQGVESSGNT